MRFGGSIGRSALLIGCAIAALAADQSQDAKTSRILTRFHIEKIHVAFRPEHSKHPFDTETLEKITSRYEKKDLTAEDLVELTNALTRVYVCAGYITSGAVIEDQAVSGNELTVTIVEAPPPAIHIKGNHIFRAGYFENRLGSGFSEAFNKGDLEARLQDLHLNPQIQRFDAALLPGDAAGDSRLELSVQEVPRVGGALQFDNYQSPAIGALRLAGTVGIAGITGYGDRLQVTYGGSSGVSPLLAASYALPVNSQGTTFLLDYRKNDFAAVGGAFRVLQIGSRSDTMGIGFRQPVFHHSARRPADEKNCGTGEQKRPASRQLVLGLDLEHERNYSSLLGEAFSFSPGAVDGRYAITAIRATAEFTVWRPGEVFAARSRLSVGLNWLGSTIHDETPDPTSLYPGERIPDSRFVSWLGQFQWTRRFTFLGLQQTESLVRADGQLANHDLLPLEQMPLGGRWSVRGFRENELVFDQAMTTSAELRMPLAQNYRWAARLDLVPFFDQGFGGNRGIAGSSIQSMGAFGVGTRWQTHFGKRFGWSPSFEFYWGFLRYHRNPADHGDLQDHGIHFQVSLSAP